MDSFLGGCRGRASLRAETEGRQEPPTRHIRQTALKFLWRLRGKHTEKMFSRQGAIVPTNEDLPRC